MSDETPVVRERAVREKHVNEAIEVAHAAFERLSEATTLAAQGQAMIDLSNAMSDLVSWHPRWDWEHGVMKEDSDV